MTTTDHVRTNLATLLSAGNPQTDTARQPTRRVLRIDADGLDCILSLNAKVAPVCELTDRPKKRVLTC